MPLTKQYLRYCPTGSFNIISSPSSNAVWTTLRNQDGRFCACGAAEDIIIWDLQLGEKSVVLPGDKTEVTILVSSPNKQHISAGFKDGSVRIYHLTSGDNIATFSGHRSSVTALTYDNSGHRLSSGSKDTHVVVWDVISESGIARLSSHSGPVTQVSFMTTHNILISSSEDTSIKFWDLDTNYCFKTLLGHRTEVRSFTLMGNSEYLVSGCGDSELRVWKLQEADDKTKKSDEDEWSLDVNGDDGLSIIKCIKLGSILRAGTGKVSRISADSSGHILAVHGVSESIELFSFLDPMESVRRLRKRLKKQKKKSLDKETPQFDGTQQPTLQDIVKRLPVIKTKGKIKSSDLIIGEKSELRILLGLNNNTVEAWGIQLDNSSETVPKCLRRISQQGHHSEIRSVTFSSDNYAMVSGSADTIKLWNRLSLSCLRTVSCGYVLSLVFAPGDRHVFAGLKDGRLLIVDINVGEIIEEIPAHELEIWSICNLPNMRGCVTGGGDKTVKFWDFELIEDSRPIAGKVLSLLHKKTLTLDDPVLCVKVTPDSKLIAVALLDMTIKIFFMDTLKFFLSLYGHKLPVASMDISSDSTLLVSGSADRNIKIWGLDFGDCHKSIFAHDAAITSVQFVPDTHYFFSCGKDGKVKQWDADNYQKIVTLQGHFGEAWTLSVSPNGDYVVSAGSDRVLRLFTKSYEPLVLEDEQEEERAQLEDEELTTGPDTTVKGQPELKLPSRKTVTSEQGAEQLMECLEVSNSYVYEVEEWEAGGKRGQPPNIPPFMMAFNTKDVDVYLIEIIKRIRSSELEESLVLLPFSTACDLLKRFPSLLTKKLEVELVIRTLTFLLKVHHGPIVSSKELLPLLTSINELAVRRLRELRDLVGYNMHGLLYLQRDLEQRDGVQLFRDATIERKDKVKKKKRKERALKRAILTI